VVTVSNTKLLWSSGDYTDTQNYQSPVVTATAQNYYGPVMTTLTHKITKAQW